MVSEVSWKKGLLTKEGGADEKVSTINPEVPPVFYSSVREGPNFGRESFLDSRTYSRALSSFASGWSTLGYEFL